MTICIAAICESGKAIVVAADRMFTAPPPVTVEFETEEQKVEELAPASVALVSGNSASGTQVVEATKRRLGGKQSPTVAEVSEFVREEYSSFRARQAEETIVTAALGSDFAVFRAKGGTLPAYLQPQPQIYQQLVMATNQLNISLDIIVAGIDGSGAHISRVTHPGVLYWLDKLGYDAIGSGGIHAVTRLSLSAQTRLRNLVETLYAVYDAKKASEVAPGVGKATDIALVELGTGVWRCTQTLTDTLEEVHGSTSKKSSPDFGKLGKVYNEQRNAS